YQPYFDNDWTALDGTNNYHLKSNSAASGKGWTPPASWVNPYFGTSNLPGDANIGALGTSGTAAVAPGSSGDPTSFALSQNYPNPFNPTTVITYTLPRQSEVTLKVYNLLGQLVSTLVNETQTGGTYSVQFNASRLSSGTYFYHLHAGQYNDVRTMMLVK
ncbi:MAG TPA: T9SS type A sorting domain-containing protein, partial [Bacteroidota bacterium]|nr:T9SS type A sorting domain-containing protein [Bacteroidota bacterium]